MGQKLTEGLCNSCDINCYLPLTNTEKSRLHPTANDDENQPNNHTSCRMALLTADWQRIIISGANDRTLQKTDELIIYHDLYFDLQLTSELKDGWFTPKFKIIGQPALGSILTLTNLGFDLEFVQL